MKSIRTYGLCLLLMVASEGYSQISPGDLTTSHANLEGMSNCTQCHDIGEKVSNTKCLECHKEIKSLISKNQGYHASAGVVKQDCFQCHSEHHGRKFDMVRFDQNNFDHKLTGYRLEGKHQTVDCRKCHISDNISDSNIRKRSNTFLGLEQKCLSCHDDFHQNTLSNDCLSCHSMDGFIPVTKFNHDKTNYPLTGKHTPLDCVECHKITTRNGKKFQEFGNMAFTDCKSCHTDPHNNSLPGKCLQCHTESSFSDFTGRRGFNHNTTPFPLNGAHGKIDCFSCHQNSTNPLAVFQDRRGIAATNCVACHEDTHEGKFGQDCAKCHNEASFLTLNNMDFFDHTVTDYPLEGKHLEVDCKQCHTDRFSTPIDFSACSSCHVDYHQGDFIKNNSNPDCKECHSLEKGFEFSLYSLEQHQESNFPLEGAHIATPCFACHISEDDQRWTFSNLGNSCVDCHLDIHDGFISEAFYPQDNCASCHVNDSWTQVNFDHSRTKWPLTGKHREVDCRLCHFEISEKGDVVSQKFRNFNTQCAACHDNVHGDDFTKNGVTDCNRCHVTSSWIPEKFDHRETAFPLTGRHTEISCKACHLVDDKIGADIVVYKLNKLKCIDCHL